MNDKEEKEIKSDWKIFALTKELEETKAELEERNQQIIELKKANYWFARSYRKYLKKIIP